MNGQFIGTANTNELEELQEDSQNADQNNDNQNGGNQQEEMMLLDDDDDLLLPEHEVQNDAQRNIGNREI